MSRKSLKILGITAVVLAIAGAGLAFTRSSEAAINIPRPGTICVQLAAMTHTFIPFGAINGPFAPTNGSITGVVGQPLTTSDGRSGFNFSVIDFNSGGTVTGLGKLNITLDTSRKPALGSFIANANGIDNTQQINLFINVDINGTKYHSAEQVTLLSTSVAAFPPPSGTAYSLVNKVTLVDDSGKAAFSLPVGQAATIR